MSVKHHVVRPDLAARSAVQTLVNLRYTILNIQYRVLLSTYTSHLPCMALSGIQLTCLLVITCSGKTACPAQQEECGPVTACSYKRDLCVQECINVPLQVA